MCLNRESFYMTRFSCYHCGAPIEVTEGATARSCGHEDSSIVADLKATAYGSASLANNPPNKIEKAVSRILDVLNIRRV